ncbi:MAG: aminopeptidase P family protein [Proteobacteria bacterium]|nr:aminopeptidase P family protein [Pseudomonadota bacterium]
MRHFTDEEFERRLRATRAELIARGLDTLLIFAQESHYYLTGFDSGGYKHFQCAVLPTDGAPITLLTRRPDLVQARRTSSIEDIRIWHDKEDANPALELKRILEEKRLSGAKLGVELATHGLTAANWERLRTTLDGWCTLIDASSVIQELRTVKSEAELVYVRRAASLADDAILAMFATARPGVDEADIIAAIDAATLRGDGDIGGPRILGSGPKALLVRSATGRRRLGAGEQLTMEWAGIYRRYHTGIFRTASIGKARPEHRALFELVREALDAMTAAARPGDPLGNIDREHRRIFDAAGYAAQRQWTAGYSLGATFPPRGLMDYPPLLYADNPTIARPGMVLFLHAVLTDERTESAMTLGHTVLITPSGREVLSRLQPEYLELI